MASCIQCGASVSLWKAHPAVVFRMEETMCEACSCAYERDFRAADDQGKFDLMARLACSPHLKFPKEIQRNMEQARQELKRKQEERRQQEEQEAARRAYTGAFASCCGKPMTELGVFTFQLGEHTFWGKDLDHLLSGSMKMAFFRCDTCGQLKQFDPEFLKPKGQE